MASPKELFGDAATATRAASFGKPGWLGFVAICLTIGSILLWSELAPLASAIIAPGTIVVNSSRKAIQHRDGGVIHDILVRDGDHVVAGQVILTMDKVRLNNLSSMLKPLLAMNIAQRGRLLAERNQKSDIDAYDEVDGLDMAEFGDIKLDQLQVLRTARASYESKIASFESEIAQAEAVLGGVVQQVAAQRERIELTRQELENAQALAVNGSGTRYRVLQITRTMAELRGDLASLIARDGETSGKVGHGRREIERSRAVFFEQVENELQQVDRDRLDLLERFRQVQSQLADADVKAPCSGIVVGLAVHTVGGVINPEITVLEIVPDGDRLVIEVQVPPADIENIHPGTPGGDPSWRIRGETPPPTGWHGYHRIGR